MLKWLVMTRTKGGEIKIHMCSHKSKSIRYMEKMAESKDIEIDEMRLFLRQPEGIEIANKKT